MSASGGGTEEAGMVTMVQQIAEAMEGRLEPSSRGSKGIFMIAARIALKAMRDPSPKMFVELQTICGCDNRAIRRQWRQMIDALMAEESRRIAREAAAALGEP